MRFFSDKIEARRSEKFAREMRERAAVISEAFKGIYKEASRNVGDENAQSHTNFKDSVEAFLVRVFKEETKQEVDVPVLEVSDETVRQFVWYSSFSHSFDEGINAGHLVAWAQNMNETVRAGRLVTMPGATVESSRGYRGLLHANAICQKMGWAWSTTEKTQKDYADHFLALLVGDLLASIFDKYGLDSEVGFAGKFGATLLNLWNVSEERKKLDV